MHGPMNIKNENGFSISSFVKLGLGLTCKSLCIAYLKI